MALLGDIFGAGGVSTLAGKVVDTVNKFIPDANAKAAAQAEIEKLLTTQDFQLAQGQEDIDKVEAASSSFFVSGWRPGVGWVCVTGLLYQFLIYPIFEWLNAWLKLTPTNPPGLDMGTLLTLLGGMLGLGSMRTYEKLKGVQGNH